WVLALTRFWAIPRTVLAISLVIVSGAGLQILFTYWHILDDRTLLIASIAWQGVMAACIAALAVPVHLLIIHDFLAARRFGADTLFFRGEAVNQSLIARPPPVGLVFRAALVGFLVWLLTYGLHIASNAAVLFAPGFLRSAAPTIARMISPSFVLLAAYV